MDHDLFDFDIVEIEDASQHLALLADIRIGTFVQIDRAAQFLLTVTDAEIFAEFDAERLYRHSD